jgi:hypothetical protein
MLIISFLTVLIATFFHDFKSINITKTELLLVFGLVNFLIISFEVVLQSRDKLHLLNTQRYLSNFINFLVLTLLSIVNFEWLIIFVYFQGVTYLILLLNISKKISKDNIDKIKTQNKLRFKETFHVVSSICIYIYSAFVFNFNLNMMFPTYLQLVENETIKSLLLIIFRFLPLGITLLLMPISQNLPTITRNMLTKNYNNVYFAKIWSLGVSIFIALFGLIMIFLFPNTPIFGYLIIIRSLCLVFTFYDSSNSLIGPVSIIVVLLAFPIGPAAVVMLLTLVTLCWTYILLVQVQK